VGRKAS